MKKPFIIASLLLSVAVLTGCSDKEPETAISTNVARSDKTAPETHESIVEGKLIPALSYSADKPFEAQYTLKNESSKDVTLNFNSAQYYDFTLTHEETQEVFQDSTDTFYSMALEETTIEKDGELVFDLKLPDTMKPGSYRLSFWLTSDNPETNDLLKKEMTFEYEKK